MGPRYIDNDDIDYDCDETLATEASEWNVQRTNTGPRDAFLIVNLQSGRQELNFNHDHLQHQLSPMLQTIPLLHKSSLQQQHLHQNSHPNKNKVFPTVKFVLCVSSLLLYCYAMCCLAGESSFRISRQLMQQQIEEENEVKNLRYFQSQEKTEHGFNEVPIRVEKLQPKLNEIKVEKLQPYLNDKTVMQSNPKQKTKEEQIEQHQRYKESSLVNSAANSIGNRKEIAPDDLKSVDSGESFPEKPVGWVSEDRNTFQHLDQVQDRDLSWTLKNGLGKTTKRSDTMTGLALKTPSKREIVVPTPIVADFPKLSSIDLTVPDQFRSDVDYFMSNTDTRRKSFPRWNLENPVAVSVFDTLVDFIKTGVQRYDEIGNNIDYSDHTGIPPLLVRTSEHNDDVIWWLPETLYVVSLHDGIFVSSKSKYIHLPIETRKKMEPTEQLMKLALAVLKNEQQSATTTSSQRWSRLRQILFDTKNEKHGSFPFLAWYGDYTGCNTGNWNNGTSSVLLFTVAGNVDCQNTFPFPNFQTYVDTMSTSAEWTKLQNVYKQKYPNWKKKIPKVVWRGSLTGRLPKNESDRGPRYQLAKLVHSSELLTEQQILFDIKVTSFPAYRRRGNVRYEEIDAAVLGGITKENGMRMEDFQKYRAVLDVDGHSWSSRFGTLMCYNSVVLKVDPQYVDYFFYSRDYNSTNLDSAIPMDDTHERILQPWKQYIPVKSDLSDLVEKVQYAVADENEAHVEQIIHNANQWCKDHMTHTQLAFDVLNTWESYVSLLDKSSPTWQEQWDQTKDTIWDGTLLMQPI